jgi:hypothetical protein
MKRIVLFLCFSLLSAIILAAEPVKSYWVVGSFDTSEAANKELARLDYWITQVIRVAAVKSGPTIKYRLLVADNTYQVQKHQLERLGIKPWKIIFSPSDLEPLMATGSLDGNLSYVLVLAGFRDEALANQHAMKLRMQSKEPIDVKATSVNNRDYYRVVTGPYDAEVSVVRDQFVLMGIDDAWWLGMPTFEVDAGLDSPREVVEPEQSSAYRIERSNNIPIVEASVNSIPIRAVMRAPKPQESYIEYCVKKANPAERSQYCRDGKFVLQSQRKIEVMGEFALFQFCATEAVGGERKQFCSNSNMSPVLVNDD